MFRLQRKFILYCCVIITFITLAECTDEQPYIIYEETFGGMVGIVKPLGQIARVRVIQGIPMDSTFSDSTTGRFEFDKLRVGFYTVEVKAEGYGKYIEHRIQVIANGINSIGEVLLKPIPEQVLSMTPSTGSVNVPLNNPCAIEFTAVMDRASVESHFSITPDIEGYFQWEERMSGSVVFYNPETQYRANMIYTFSLSTKAKTIYGDTLSFPISSSFITEPVKVETYAPEDGANYVKPKVSVYLRFNTAMNRRSVESSFTIIPPIRGRFIWQNNQSFSFIPETNLATSSQYYATVTQGAKDIYDTALHEVFTFTFTIEPLMITNDYPNNGSTDVSRNVVLYFSFNTEVEQRSVEEAFSIIPETIGTFIWTDLTKFSFKPEDQLPPQMFYFVTIDTSCTDLYGQRLPDPFSLIFKTGNQ